MAELQSIHVPHLGGINASYCMPKPYDAKKPTLVLVNSLTTSAALFRPQFRDEALTKEVNLLAIEPLGHGETRTKSETWTYWDIAIMNIQVLEALKIVKAFALGTSQGGWIVVRMALLAPSVIQGVIPLGTAMDFESPRTRELGCWNGYEVCNTFVKAWSSTTEQPDFDAGDQYRGAVISLGFGQNCSDELRDFWLEELKKNYAGEAGRRRVRMCALNIAERDGLLGRLEFVKCPVLWLHGTEDAVFSVPNAEQEIEMFTGTSYAELKVIQGGQHFLSGTHPTEVNEAALGFIKKFNK